RREPPSTALSSRAVTSSEDSVDSVAFAIRRLMRDERYQRQEPAFARLLAATVERRLGQMDGILMRCVDKYPPKATLRIAVAQLLFVKTPLFATNHT
ncbi:LOW QUALITY PROTEIN: hypothetical protein ACHAW6_000784, partial [Cyclotella cf. meneghiniana]